MKKVVSLLFATTMFFVAVAGCATTDSVEDKILVTAGSVEIITLDTNVVTDNMSGLALYHLSEGLLRVYDDDIHPGVAENWDISDDGLTYTFNLRDSVWEDGEPVTAHDFVFSFRRFFSPDTAAATADQYYYIENARGYHQGELDESELGVRAVDERILEITLEHPVPYFLWTVATSSTFFPVRQDIVEAAGGNYGGCPDTFLANGPFTLVEWHPEASMLMEKNENYWNADAVKLDGIERLVIPDANARLSMFDSGDVHTVESLPAGQEVNYPDFRVYYSGASCFLQFNMVGTSDETGELLSNINFRKALSYAIDREAWTAAAMDAFSVPANRITHPAIQGINDTFNEEFPLTDSVPLRGDADQAREYLDLALEELGITTAELPSLTFISFDVETRRIIAEALIDTWESVLGLEIFEIQMFPIPQAMEAIAGGQYDLYFQSFGGDLDPYHVMAYFHSASSLNWARWADPEFDEMLEAINTILDPADRFAALQELEQHMLDHGPLEPLAFQKSAYIVQDNVVGIEASYVGSDFKYIFADIID